MKEIEEERKEEYKRNAMLYSFLSLDSLLCNSPLGGFVFGLMHGLFVDRRVFPKIASGLGGGCVYVHNQSDDILGYFISFGGNTHIHSSTMSLQPTLR